MSGLTRREAARWLKARDNFLILTHRRPDGDTVGSAAALCLGLRKLGKQAWVLKNEEISDRFGWLVEGLTKEAVEEHDIVVSVDVASPGMLPKAFVPYQERIELRIDHHGTATSFTPNELVEPLSAACAEIIYDILEELGVALDKDIAQALYVGTSTDTGCFRFANTTAHSFRVAAACAEAGAPVFEINLEMFETNSLARLRIQGWMAENSRFLDDGKLVICAIPKAVEERLGVTEDDMDNISGFPRTIAGVKMAATLRENKEDGVKMSIRAVPGYDAAAVCAKFGGGGHKGAAGASIALPLEEAAKEVEKAMLAI
jgi:phosphoesterase RecJ-like protein